MPSRRPGQSYRHDGPARSGRFGGRKAKTFTADASRPTESTSQDERLEATRLAHSIDESMGFARYESGKPRVGWLCNMHSTAIEDDNVPGGRAAVDFYFLEDDGGTFKATVEYEPYFLLAVKRGREAEVEDWLRRKFDSLIRSFRRVEKEDLKLPNHLLGYRRTFVQLNFANVTDLLAVRKVILPVAERNKKNVKAMDAYAEVASADAAFDLFDQQPDQHRPGAGAGVIDAADHIVDIREYDVPYHVRVAMDNDIRIGKWYTVEARHGLTSLTCIDDRLQRADAVVMAYDIETTKLPLKFPDAAVDQVMMISYMIDGQGFLITNREIVADDIADFEYTPKPEYDGPFLVFNEPDEKAVLERFLLHIKEARPTVIATYNGDFFDWPFVEARASLLGIDLYREIGFRKDADDVYRSDHCSHMDCFSWVKRDSYLPQGSQGLKAVTVAKLGYDPDELDPELMTRYAAERPQTLAEYSVSDAVATYYLYMKYVHPFVFSLCTIVPLNPDDVLRKGTGTLCEMLLMVQAYRKAIVLPNKHQPPREAFWDGHLLESETYVGGHVESIEAGVFRSDIPVNFALDPAAVDELLGDLDAALRFSVEVEAKRSLDDLADYDAVKADVAAALRRLRDTPNRLERPAIYHLDVASMYPNIMTTNRLQPDSMIQEADCAACDFNRPGKTCDRRLPWSWRAEFLPAKRDEYNMIRRALERDSFPARQPGGPARAFADLGPDEQAALVKKRLQEYSRKIYHKIHDTRTVEREAIVCQRENPFYVDTVRDFRNRRYDFKRQQKVWKGKVDALRAAAADALEVDEARKMVVVYDSLQLAHKVILNSFYGYVMRKGSRWYSMEMAGVTCLTGAHIIQMARRLVERVGRPLELDTDGIWCILPASFPQNFAFALRGGGGGGGGKKLAISYPCVMLNHLVHRRFTNHQYQTLADPASLRYETSSDNSIFFEVDGPYRAMILPTSKEEDKNLKKRYAVFNHDGSLAELKGFEVKRRGELKLIKIFQQQIFKFFLEGATLPDTYAAVARVADRWLDVLHQRGATLADDELIDLICENRSMSKTLAEYGGQKSTSITTARRLAAFLGEQMTKDKGLNCKYIISASPANAPVTERAIPVAIFAADEPVRRFFLRKWLRHDPADMDPRSVIDWAYYLDRLGSVVQKLITIPAALQKVRNPVPRVAHPDWLQRRIDSKDDRLKQRKVTDHFAARPAEADVVAGLLDRRLPDLEDFGSSPRGPAGTGAVAATATKMVQKRKAADSAAAAAVDLDPYASLPATMPAMTQDYGGWLRYQKQKWKIQGQARARRRRLFGERSQPAGDALGGLFRNQAALLYSSRWQVLQLRGTDVPGEVRAFVLIDGKVRSLKILVRRQVFINLKSADLPRVDVPDCSVEPVRHTLPNGHPSVHLFRLSMSEDVYVREAQRLAGLFNHPSVEGVYEREVPLHVRAVLDLGGSCTIDQARSGVLGRGLDQGFELESLRSAPSPEPYLSRCRLAYLFVYHVVAGDRQIFAVFSTTRQEAQVVVLTRGREAHGLPNLDKIYAEALSARMGEDAGGAWRGCLEYQERIRFETRQVTTKRKAHVEVGDAIKKMQQAESRPLMLVLQSSQRRMLSHDVPVLNEFPVLPLRPAVAEAGLPALGWQAVVAKRLVAHYLTLGSWIGQLIELARYGDVPLGNLERDDPGFLIDVAYARRLQRSNVILWWSAGPLPDHAGYEKDDVVGPMETVEMPSINKPGTYSSVCIELEVRNLAINTILTSSLINELEGSDSVAMNPAAPAQADGDGGGAGGANVLYADRAFASAGIAVLREMVKAWWTEACKGSGMADVMVQHLVRWVASPASFLYDRSLHYYVQTMSRKAFQQMMTDFRQVGSQVIYASANRLLLQTSKGEVGNAYAYSQYVLTAIKKNALFHFLDLEIKEYWDYLVWYDAFNYGGRGCREVVEESRQTLDTIMHWQMASFLPNGLQSVFHDWVVEFIELMHGRKHEGGPAQGTARSTQLPFRPVTEEAGEERMVLEKSFEKPLKKQVAALVRRQAAEMLHPELAGDYLFPKLPGSHQELANPVLQLVKALMQVLSLDRGIMLEARLLRKELLALFEVREFSGEAAFSNPSESLVVEQVICDHCTLARDLDLCRDEDLLPAGEVSDAAAAGAKQAGWTWRCQHCRREYDKLRIEERLVGQVESLAARWSVQDVRCSKCGRVRLNEFMEHCACSGPWASSLDRGGVVERALRVYGRVAEAYGLRMLADVVAAVGSRAG